MKRLGPDNTSEQLNAQASNDMAITLGIAMAVSGFLAMLVVFCSILSSPQEISVMGFCAVFMLSTVHQVPRHQAPASVP
jgi:hypothetical protein